ncbi:MAG: nicotinate (nicotinamide) nucleotide adenylyltransferase [Candidatus Marinimicrobia bacterium]|nr:nicotinate (nicotinamide) nucleotide adenylyltransferase [Candidatus Neomarinimicrobiota bacterium]
MKIGLFGGTFDPPHLGHIRLALYVLNEKNLQKVMLVPAYKTPYDDKQSTVSFEHRFSMAKLAVEAHPDLEVSDIEGKRGGQSYTIDTIRQVKKLYGLSSEELYLIVGADGFLRFSEWKEPESILTECRVCVLKRNDIDSKNYNNEFLKKAELLDNDFYDVSSRELRNRIANGDDLGDLIDSGVSEYIRENGLYV